MALKKVFAACLSAVLPVLPMAVMAQDVQHSQGMSIGQAEFANSCAQCHGTGGAGDGVMAGYLNATVPDLTQLQKNNGGVFPVSRVYNIIDGSEISGAHGTSEMPAWGLRYLGQAPAMLGFDYGREDQEIFVRTRILALVEYISSLQEQ